MSRFIDEDDIWKAKKVWRHFEKKQKSTYSYRNKKKYIIVSSKSRPKKNTEVVVKITGSSKNYGALKAHLRYISRNGNIPVMNENGEVFNGKEELKDLYQSYNNYYKIPTEKFLQDNSLKERRETLNIVFSMKDFDNAPVKKIQKAAINTIKKKYPHNYFVIAMHNDTDNPHCHLSLKITDNFGKRINPKKADLNDLRKEFALELNKLNVEATATIRRRINTRTNEELEQNIYIKDEYNNEKINGKKHKAHHYKVVDYGRANYKFDPKGEDSFYVRYRTSKGKDIEIWSKDLERVVAENNVLPNDYCRFVITGEEQLVFRTKQIIERDEKRYLQDVIKTAYKKSWDVSIEGKNEKELKPLKEFTPTKTEVLNEKELLHKKGYSQVVSYGEANYRFNPISNQSFYVRLQNEFGDEKTLWSKDLKSLIDKNGVTVGEYCKFAVVDKKPVELSIYDKEMNARIKKTTYQNIWDVSVQGRLEKQLPVAAQKTAKFEISYSSKGIEMTREENIDKVGSSGGIGIIKDKSSRHIRTDRDIK